MFPRISGYVHVFERRVQLEQAGLSPGHRVFFLLPILDQYCMLVPEHRDKCSSKLQDDSPTILARLVQTLMRSSAVHDARVFAQLRRHKKGRKEGR
jgi:hypothetical protein